MHALILNLNGAAVVWREYVFRATWEASLVAVIALALLRFARRWPAPLRAAVLLVAMLKFLVPPMLPSPFGVFPAVQVQRPTISVQLPPTPLAALPAPSEPTGSLEVPTLTSLSTPPFSPPVKIDSAAASPPAPRLTGLALLMLAHAAGSLVVACAVGIGLLRLRRLAHRAKRLSEGPAYERMTAIAHRLNIPPPRRLLLSPDRIPPMAFGVLRQVVMLPQAVADSLAPQSLDAVLAHELAHHRRRDTLATILQLLALIVWWFNPLIWLLGREFRRTREECCDDTVLAQGIAGGADYCNTILAAAEHLAAPFPLRGALSLAEPMHPLGNRMRRIMDPSLPRSSRLSRAALAAVLIVAAVVLPGTRLRGQQQPNISPPQQQGLSILHITVTSEADGTPISGATLHFRIRAHPLADAHTDAEGGVTIASLPPVSCIVEATAPGKANVVKTINLDTATDNTVSFSLPAGGSVSGKITNANGNPVVGMGLNVYQGENGNPLDYVTTNSEGAFKFDHLPLIEPLRVLVDGDDSYQSDWGNITLWPSQPQGTLNFVTLAKPPGGSVAGTVVDADGKPIAQAEIFYRGISSRTKKTVNTDAAGAFRLDGMQFNQLPVQIIVRADGWAPMAVNIAALGTKDEPAKVAAHMTEKGHHITGRVVDEAGVPIASVRVSAGAFNRTIMDDRTATITTRADGRFTFDSLPAR
ncbi:MAG: carboxypeptidase regulatory-like domain-containing protein, partial [Tepidisphaeraceae bacterium]